MLELYEQNRMPPSNEVKGSTGGGAANQPTTKAPTSNDEPATTNSNSQSSRPESSKPASSKPAFDSSAVNHGGRPISNHGRSSDYGNSEMKHMMEDDAKGNQHPEWESLSHKEISHEGQDIGRSRSDNGDKDDHREDKVKAALEKRRKALGHITKKMDFMDDDDLIEKELEEGIELAPQTEKNKQERRQSWSKPSDRSDYDNVHGRH
ncbi:hypothetical protein PIB30_048201 [Stylosanthes scabra]|uniref:Uncharacterized protein n=1 Tax=Stylosanthes scabra TaxID=79078 RepID=A0ABU6QGV7_9FABA|nr:hypothetical protein [Stylosanthes scabra]